MSRKILSPASGTGTYFEKAAKVIRFVRYGCTNRPFFHIVVMEKRREQYRPVIEQLGSHDPLPNEHNEKLTSLNYERIRYWIGNGATVSKPVEELLGLAGFFPIHPTSYMYAWKNRKAAKEAQNRELPPNEKVQDLK